MPGREPRDNPRFVITNLRPTPRFIYEHVYCARGDIENRIKEFHEGLQLGRTSCCRFWANQLRALLTAAAYVLMQELRLRAARTACARTQVCEDGLISADLDRSGVTAAVATTCRRPGRGPDVSGVQVNGVPFARR